MHNRRDLVIKAFPYNRTNSFPPGTTKDEDDGTHLMKHREPDRRVIVQLGRDNGDWRLEVSQCRPRKSLIVNGSPMAILGTRGGLVAGHKILEV